MADSCMSDDRFLENYDPKAPEIAQDPWPVWKALRERCPVAHSDRQDGFWISTRYDDVSAIASDSETFSNRTIIVPLSASPDAIPLTLDPPEHTKFRRALLPAFAQPRVDTWEPMIRQIAEDQINRLDIATPVDVATEYALPVPLMVIVRLLGIDQVQADLFLQYYRALLENKMDEDPELTAAARQQLTDFLLGQIGGHRADPQDDVLGFMLQAEVDGEGLTDEEVARVSVTLLGAGFDTTFAALGHSLVHLATHPDDRRRLVEALGESGADLWSSAVEEFLRAYAPVTMARYVNKTVEIRNQTICEGEVMLLAYPSANRDPAVFADPDQVIIDRSHNRHLTFGAGVHRCLGANLARLELRVALQTFLRHFPEFHLEDGATVEYRIGQVWGPRSIPVVIDKQGEA